MKNNFKKIFFLSFCFLSLVNVIFLLKTHLFDKQNKQTNKSNQELLQKIDYSSKSNGGNSKNKTTVITKNSNSITVEINQPNKIQKATEYLKQFRKPSSNSFHPTSDFFVNHNFLPNDQWVGIKNFKLIPKSDLLNSEVVIAEFSNQYIIKDDKFEFDLNHFKRNQQGVVYNTRLKKIGMITGFIKVVTTDKAALLNRLNSLQAEIVNSFDQIQTYYISGISSEFDLLYLFNVLRAEAFISEVEIDIADREYEKK